MLYAVDESGVRIEPTTSGERAFCPLCGDEVVGRCGRIVIPHWAHLSGGNCDPWHEPISEWHYYWQLFFHEYMNGEVEVPMTKDGERHFADVVLRGVVIELQHSSISVDEVEEREEFYDRMVWIFDAQEAYEEDRLSLRDKGSYHTFSWKHPRKTIYYAKKPVFLDVGEDQIFRLRKVYLESRLGGWGRLKPVDELDWRDFQ